MCHKIRLRACLLALALGGSLAIVAAHADEDEDAEGEGLDRTPQDCIATNRIRGTDVVDDRTILFAMRGGQHYTNILERECPGLERHKRFMHETTGGRLCDIDTITVLEQWTGRLTPGFTCRLGQFHPITAVEAQDLRMGPDEAAAIDNDIEVKEVVLPPGEDEPVDEQR